MKKSMKSSLSVYVIILSLLCSFFVGVPVQAEETVTTDKEGDYSFTVTDNQATVTAYDGTATDVVIPATLGGYTVVALGNQVFQNNTTLVSVSIPDTVTQIGKYAFYYCTRLERVTLPSNLVAINNGTFSGCSALTSVTIPNSVQMIGKNAFKACSSLTSITIPSSVKTIDEKAFYECQALVTVNFEEGLTEIGFCAFACCSNLTNINLPLSLTTLGDSAFLECNSLVRVVLPATLKTVEAVPFYECIGLREAVILSKDIVLKGNLFNGCDGFLVIYYPEGLVLPKYDKSFTTVSYTVNADDTVNLTLQHISATVITSKSDINLVSVLDGHVVNEVTVADGVNLADIELKVDVPFTITAQPTAVSSVYGDATNKTLTVGMTKKTEDTAVTYQWYENDIAIPGATAESYTIPATKVVGSYTYHCEVASGVYKKTTEKAVATITKKPITVSVDSITKLQGTENPVFTYTVPAGNLVGADTTDGWVANLTTTATKDSPIGEYPITGIITATNYEVTVTAGVLKIYQVDEEEVNPDAENYVPEVGDKFQDTKKLALYKITKLGSKSGKVGSVQYVKPVNKKKSTVTIPATIKVGGIKYKVTSIAKSAFKSNKYIKKVTIGKYVTSIGSSAFYNCKKLKTVTLGSGLTTIGDKAFYRCVALTKITIPSKVSKIGKSAFYGCKKLKTITIKTKKLTDKKIGSKAFKGIHTKATIKVPKAKLTSYKKILKKKGIGSKVKIVKI